MNKNNAASYLPLVQALAEGKTLQFNSSRGWVDQTESAFTFPASDYRIKPEPRVVWLTFNSASGHLTGSFEKEEDARNIAKIYNRKVVKFVEVL